MSEIATSSTTFKMDADMRVGPLTLRVKDLDTMLGFYEGDLGLRANNRYHDPVDNLEVVELVVDGARSAGTNGPLLILKHDPNASEGSSVANSAGLYHFAILVADRKSLASTYLAIGNSGVYFEGFADHSVSEALYLRDPESNGIEIYRDRPRSEWKYENDGQLHMDTLALDVDSLLKELSSAERKNPVTFPTGAGIGHIHLKVTNLNKSINFYHGSLGLDIMMYRAEARAAFLSSGGYHHHIGLNTWESLNGKPHKKGEAGLENFTITVSNDATIKAMAARMNCPEIPSQHEEGRNPDEFMLLTDPDNMEIIVKSK
jgi:catechol 2,3-dioxygenase